MSAHSPALLATLKSAEAYDPAARLDESEHYLQHTIPRGTVFSGIKLQDGITTLSVYRIGDPTVVWLSIGAAGFNAFNGLNLQEARLAREALTKAIEDAEEAQRAIDWQQDIEFQREHDRLIEDELCREAEERGEEYVPAAIGTAHMNFIELAMLHGHALKPWQEALKPTVNHFQLADGGHTELDGCGLGVYSTWSRWPEAAATRFTLQVRHSPTDTNQTYPAIVDDFGTLVIVPEVVQA